MPRAQSYKKISVGVIDNQRSFTSEARSWVQIVPVLNIDPATGKQDESTFNQFYISNLSGHVEFYMVPTEGCNQDQAAMHAYCQYMLIRTTYGTPTQILAYITENYQFPDGQYVTPWRNLSEIFFNVITEVHLDDSNGRKQRLEIMNPSGTIGSGGLRFTNGTNLFALVFVTTEERVATVRWASDLRLSVAQA